MTPSPEPPEWPPGSSEMARRVRAFDWASTPLGPLESWSPEQRIAAAFVLENRFPAALVLGPGLVTLYNDAFRPILGEKPEALGRSFADIWSEAWDEIGPMAELALAGESTFIENLELVVQRHGRPERAWFTFSYSPVRASDGKVVGFVDTVVETTDSVLRQRELAQSEQRYRTLFEAIDSGFCIIEMIYGEDGRATDYRFVEANSAFERQSGLFDAVGRRIREFAPNLEEHWFERYGRVALTGESMRIDGEVAPLGRWFDINAFRVGAPEQHRVAVLFTDITDRIHAESAFRTSQEQFEILLNQAPLGVYLVDGDLTIRQVNPIASPVFGDLPGGPVGRDFDEVIHILWAQEYADEVVRIFRHTLETGEPYVTPERAEYRVDRDVVEYYEWRLDRIILSDGQYGVVCYFRDISAQVNARKEIEKGRDFTRESEERLRLIVENAQDYAIFTTDPDGIVTDWRAGAVAVFGYTGEEMTGKSCNTLFLPEDREARQPEKERATAAEHGKAGDVRWHLRKDGSRVFIDGVSTALRDQGGRLVGFLKIAQDVTARHNADERQRLLLAELQHRVRNILGMIRSVARRTAETSDTVPEYAQHLEGRINAMARTQAMLTRKPGNPVDLESIVQSELLSVVAQEDKVWCEGPAVCLEPKAAEILTLAIHELATNAVKYGAFSQPAGQLEIRWEVEVRGSEQWLVFIWEEARVEGVPRDGREGFGTELITRRVPYELGGSGTYELRCGGIRTMIEFPLRVGGSILETSARGLGESV